VIVGSLQALAMVRVARRRRGRGDTPRVAAMVAARRRFAPNLIAAGLLMVAMTLALGLAGAAGAIMVELGILLGLPVAQSIRTGVAR
jgi:hypothetical protein